MAKENLDVLLIDPPWYRFFGQQKSTRPIGLCSLAAVLEKNGIQSRVYNADLQRGAYPVDAFSTTKNYAKYLETVSSIDAPIWKEAEAVIREYNPKIVGITVLTPKYQASLTLGKLVKRINPEIKVVVGGLHPTLLPEETINNDCFDFLVFGEGEYSFLDLTRAILEGKMDLTQIRGIVHKVNGKIVRNAPRELVTDLDELPHPVNYLIINKEKMLPDDFSRIFASRGCPYNCIFCASNAIWSKKVRYRSPENVINEIERINTSYNPAYFHFEDDSFSLNISYVKQICTLLLSKNIRINWGCETRVDLLTDDLLKIMKKAGCSKILLGAESGSELTLKKIKKNITLDQIRRAVKICKKNRMETAIFFMIGFPWEGEDEIKQTVDFMKELDPQFAVYSISTPYPATELYEMYKQDGLIPKNINWSTFFHQSPGMFLTNKLPKDRLQDIIESTEKEFLRHNRKKQRLKMLNPYKLFLELKEHYKSPRELWVRVKYVLNFKV
ncbi:MAG: radical SAM protein [Candidatus Omnitrophota bacterium]